MPVKKALAKVFLLVSVTVASSAQVVPPTGSIIGRVVDQNGSPIESARVHAELHGVPMSMAIQYVETDREGSFTIDRLSFGEYDVTAIKRRMDTRKHIGRCMRKSRQPPPRSLLNNRPRMSCCVLGQEQG